MRASDLRKENHVQSLLFGWKPGEFVEFIADVALSLAGALTHQLGIEVFFLELQHLEAVHLDEVGFIDVAVVLRVKETAR